MIKEKIELTHEEEYQIKKMYLLALQKYCETKDIGWQGYEEGIRDVLIELGIEIEGITD